MKSWLKRGILVLLALLTIPAHPIAQGSATPAVTVSPNVNVLRNVSDPLLGDANLQRQTEPVVAVSTRNPDHIMVAANDYRTVDIASDQGIGQVFVQAIRTISRTAEKLWARITGRSEPPGEAEEEERERAEAGTEAWIGVYITNDRGRNWTNAWMPGYPQDTSAAGKGSPAYGRQAASDPVLVAAPAGRFYLGAMAFDRGGESRIVVSRFTDRNNSEKGNNFHFDLMRAVDGGSTGRQFLDKPSIVADVARSIPDAGACGPVYIGYTVFDSKASDPSDRSKIFVATSLDCGNTWLAPRKINRQSKLVQGVSLAVRPSDGRLYAVYRDFEANRMFVTWADDRGYTFAPPVDTSGPMLTFDQPSLGAPDYAFRSNAFPTIAATGDNKIYVAWQERLAANGNPRIVVTSSVNGGPWAVKKAVEADRCVKNANGTTTCGVQAGPQVMPSLTSSRGHLLLAFYEARPGIDNVKFVTSQNASYITGLDVQLYLRVAQLDASGKGVSAIATQYEVDKDGKPLPLIATDGATEYRGANRPNLPMYAGGKFPFIGDYISIAPSMPFVRTAPNAASTTASNSLGFFKESTTTAKKDATAYWRWATESNDGPTASFQAAWTDNRDVIFPKNAAGVPRINGDWSQYAPPGFGPCINPGSRNANVYTAEIAPRLVAGSPTTFKEFGIQRAFVLYLQNRTADRKFFRMTIVDTAAANGSFVQRGQDVNVRDVEIFPLSTVTDTVYVNGGSATSQPVRVDIAELDRQGGALIPGGDTASVSFNGDNSNPPLETLAPTSETHTPKLFTPGNPHSSLPRISNPQLANPQLANPQLANPQLANPQLANPQLANLQLTNSPYADPSGDVVRNVTNYTWQITNAGSTASAFTPVFNIANQAALAGKKTRLVIHNTYKTPALVQTPNGCQAVEQPRDVIISVIENPQLANPQLANPQLANPQLANPQLANSTFYVAPSDSVSSAGTAAGVRRNVLQNVAFQTPGPGDADLTINIPPPDTFITLSIQDGDTFQVGPPPPPPAPGEPPPASNPPLTFEDFEGGNAALGVVSSAAPVINGVVQPIVESVSTSADLVFSSVPTVTPLSLQAGGLVTVSSFDVTVVGNAPTAASGFRYGFYLSTTLEINPSTAVFLGSLTHEGAISPAQVVTLGGGTFAIPPLTTPGPYYVGVFLNDGQMYTPPQNPYLFESFANDTVSLALAIAAPVGPAPTSSSDTAQTIEELTLNVAAPGVLGNDGNAGPVTAVLSLGASHGSVTLNANGSYTYVPNGNYFGPDAFTYYATNGTLASPLATVSITVQPVNDAPSFTKGPDQTVPADEAVSVPGWATFISAGPNESQALDFIVTADNPGVFATPPTITPSGTLAFTAGHAGGSTPVHVTLHDNGGTAPGVNVSATQTFNVTVQAPPGPSSNLQVTQVRTPASPTVGSTITYTVTVTNLGPDPADAVTMTDTIPQGLTLQSAVPSVGQCVPGALSNVCSLGTLANQVSATIVIQYTAISAQPVNHTVAASTPTSDPVAANNTATDATMVVYQPCGAATFQGPNLFPLNGTSQGVTAVADFNHDDRPDLAITVAGTNQIAIVLGGPPIPTYINVGSNPTAVVAGDFNNDGNPDLGVVNNASASVSVLLGDGAGGFAPAVNYPVPPLPFTNAIGDFNGDHNLDMAIGYTGTATTNVAVLLGDGAGHFGAATTYPSGQSPINVLVADYDGDGNLDIAVPNTGATTIALLRGNGSGSFAAPLFVNVPGAGPVVRLRDLGDVNKDGRPDLGVTTGTNNANNLMLLLNTGGGSFGTPTEIIGPIGIQWVTSGDFNGDGNPDLAANNFTAQRLIVLLGDSAGHFAQSASYAIGGGASHFVPIDVNGDARIDIVGGALGAFFVMFNECSNEVSSDLTVVATAPANVANGASFSYLVDVTNNGPAVASSVVMTSSYPSGTTFVSATVPNGTCSDLNGVVSCHQSSMGVGATVTFTVTLNALAAGVRTVNASATSLSADAIPADNYSTASTTVAVGPSTLVVTTTADSGPGSLRQAITDSNLNTGSTNTILYNIQAPAPWTIALNSQLPNVTVPVFIDGNSQPGFSGASFVTLDGANSVTNGLVILSGGSGSTVRGLGFTHFAASGVLLQTTTVNVTLTGNTINANGSNGVFVLGTNNKIGGLGVGEGNTITNNGGAGVGVASGTGNAIRHNSIFTNVGLGIDIGQFTGLTPNDPGDGDSGPNNLQNFPVLTVSQVVGGITTIAGTVNSNANTSFGVDLFTSPVCDPSGNGEGQQFLGSLTVGTDGAGNGSFSTTTFSLPLGQFVTATATDNSGNTSEFSACRQVVTGLVVSSIDNPEFKVESGGFGSGFILLDAHHDGGPVPQVLATANFGPTGKPNLTLPGVMAVLPAGPGEPGIGYFAAGGRIGILDLANRQVTGAIEVEGDPTPTIVRANTVTRFAYFASGNRLFAIDGRSASPTFNQVVLTTTIGAQIRALALNESNGRLYVVSTTSGSTTSLFSSQITAIDTNPANPTFHQVLRTGAVSSNTGVNDAAVNPATNKIYIVDTNSLRVVVDNGTTLVSTQIFNVPSGSSVAVNPAKNVIYVSNGFSNITVIDGATDTRITAFTLPTTGGPSQAGEGRLVIHNATGRVFYHYADGPRSSRITVLDGDPTHVAPNPNTFNTVLDTIDTGWETNASFMAIDQAADRLILYNNHTHSALIFNALTDAVVATAAFPQASIRPLALDLTTHTVYASVFAGAIHAIDLNTGAAQLIHTGTETRAPVVDKTSHLAYVPRTGADTGVAVVNASGLLSTITPPAGAGVLRFAERNATTNRIYVGNFGANAAGDLDPAPGAVSVINGSTKTIIANINVGNRPVALAVDEVLNKVYVGNTSVLNDVSANYQTWAGITIIDGATNTATPANLNGIATGALAVGALAVNPTTGRVYLRITSGSTATMGYYDPSTNTAAALPASLGQVAQIKVNPVLNRIYLSGSDNKLHVLDGTTHTEVATLTMGSANPNLNFLQNWIAINKATGRVYVADRDAETLWIVNGQTNAVVTNIAGLENPIAVAVNEAQNRVYVLEGGDDTLVVIDGTTNKIVQSIQLPMNPVAMAVDDNIVPAQIYVSGDCPGAAGCVDTNSGVVVVSDPVDPNGPITLSAVSPAAHGTISLNPDGSVSYTSNAGFTGVDQFGFTVTDTHGASATGTINLYIVTLPQMTTTSLAGGRLGQPYSQALAATGGTPPYRWVVDNNGQLPPGLILNEVTGVISGVPSLSGTYSVTLNVFDENDGDSKTFSIVIGPIAIISGFPNPTINTLYSNQLFTGGQTGAVTWSLDKQNSPLLNWLTLSPSGLLSGTPPIYGNTPQFVITATDTANNETSVRIISLNVVGPLDIVPTTLREGVVLETGQPALPIVGGSGTKTVTLLSGQASLPPGVTLNAGGSFSGSPTTHGSFTFTVQVTDQSSPQQSVTRTLNWRVSAREQLSNASSSANIAFGGPGGRRMAQTFTVAAAGKLTGVGSFNISCSLQGPLTVEIQRLNLAGVPDATTIASGVSTNSFGAIGLTSPLDVSIDDKLAFILSSPTPCTISNAPLNDSNYQAGDAYADAGSGWTALAVTDSRYDIPFRTLIQPAKPVVYFNRGRYDGARASLLTGATKAFVTGTDNTGDVYDQATNLATVTVPMNASPQRFNHTSTLLDDGTVLLAGGRDSVLTSVRLTSAEIYNPTTGTYTLTGSMTTARESAEAVKLPNGKVLIVGGYDGNQNLASAELYDPIAHTFSLIGPMTTGRNWPLVVPLNNGKILIAAGYSGFNPKGAELFDPIAGTFTATSGSMVVSNRGRATGTLLNDGRVLITGGQNGDVRAEAEIYDPLTDSFTAAAPMLIARFTHTATLLSDGSVLIAGGYSTQNVNGYILPLATMERYIPGTNAWVPAGSMEVRRSAHEALPLQNGKVLLVGGTSQNAWFIGNTGELYDLGSAPALTSTTVPDGQVNVAYPATPLSATGGAGGPYQIAFVSGTLPPGTPGIQYDQATKTLSGTPMVTGSFTAGFRVTDSLGNANVQTLTIRVGSLLTITSPYRLTDAAVNHAYLLQLAASAPSTWSIPLGSPTLPPGLNLSSGGLITGTPNTLGYYNFVVRAVDASGQFAVKSLSINVMNPLVITTSSLPEAVLWDSYNRCVSTTNWVGTRTFSVIGGTLPAGVSLQANTGCFAGTVSGIGTTSFTIQVADTASPPQTNSLGYTVRASAQDVANGGATVNSQPIGQTSQRSVARTFTPSASGILTAAQVWGLTCPSQNPTVQVTARLFRASPTSGEPSTLLTTGSGDWFDPIKFGATVTVGQGEQYAIEFLIPSSDCTISTPTTTVWTPGDTWQKIGNGAWQRMVGADVQFRMLMLPLQSFNSLSTWRGAVAAAATSSGRILIAGGDTNSADLYDPVANTVTPTGSMTFSRRYHTATSLGASGKVLITGGYDLSGIALLTAEVWDPSTGTFTATANNMSVARAQHTATPIAGGRVLIVGGANGSSTATAQIYDSVTNSFTPAASMAGTRWAHSATVLPNDGRVLVVGGNSNGPFPVPNGEVYDPVLNTWTPTSEPIQALRSRHGAFALADGRVMVVGGSRLYPTLEAATEIYNPGTNQLTAGPSLLIPRLDPVVVGNLILGGSASDAFGQEGLSAVERYNSTSNTFEHAGNLMTKRFRHGALSIGGGKIAAFGGYGGSSLPGRSLEVFGPDPAPALQPGAAPNAQLGQTYGPFTFNFAGTAPFQLGLYSGAVADSGLAWTPIPSGPNYLGFNLSGVPTAVGSFPFNLFVSDSLGQQRTQPFGVRVDPVIITTTQLPQATNGVAYSQQIQATTLHGPLTWKILSNTGAELTSGAGLPTGLTLSSGGAVSGTPTVLGFYTFNVRVSDSLNQSAIAIVGIFIQ